MKADGEKTSVKLTNQQSPLSLQYFAVQFNKGEHGFDNQEMDMKPFFRAVGPAFQKNLVVGPFETVNVYPLMCHILGITPEVNDGHLDATKHMLVRRGTTRDGGSTSHSDTCSRFGTIQLI